MVLAAAEVLAVPRPAAPQQAVHRLTANRLLQAHPVAARVAAVADALQGLRRPSNR